MRIRGILLTIRYFRYRQSLEHSYIRWNVLRANPGRRLPFVPVGQSWVATMAILRPNIRFP